jgi:hypothetical protein
LAAEAFIYGYPLVADLEQVVRYTTEGAGVLIAIQRDAPQDSTERANWLPCPKGNLRPALRVYNPQQGRARRQLRATSDHPY